MLFQPVVDLLTGDVLGYEALGRVSGREEDGFRLLSLYAERDQIYEEMLATLARLSFTRGAFRPPGSLLFLNVSRPLLQRFLDDSDHRLPSYDGLVFEIPESDHQISQWPGLLVPFVTDGVAIALDDWGAGQADPLRLAEIRPAWVKVDLKLTQKVGLDPSVDRLITLLVNWLGENRAKVIAEGIETEEQLIRLRHLGVRYGQGYGLARPQESFPLQVPIPDPGRRLGRTEAFPLALSEAFGLKDEHLQLVESQQVMLAPLLDAAIVDLADWIHQAQISPNLDGLSSKELFVGLLQMHFHALTRGYLGAEDRDRAEKIVAAHRRHNVDMTWFALGYRHLQHEINRRLRAIGADSLATALTELFTWDLGMVLHRYQQVLEHDHGSPLLNAQTFWDRVSLDARQRLTRDRRALFILIQIEGTEVFRKDSGGVRLKERLNLAARHLSLYATSQAIVGRLASDEFGLWTDDLNAAQVNRLTRHLLSETARVAAPLDVVMASAVLGRDGTTPEALYARADQRLTDTQRRQRPS